ncbi:hypothetical protein [Thermithiobacillus plumbiphilus]|uniref:PilZ domain-containing protein n=1 Tax=Thermithiobacillus plumbiphilus TaxID=1729899 RepID=A0ABU9D4S4_9PROT
MTSYSRKSFSLQYGGWISSRVHMQNFLHKHPGGSPPFSGDLARFLDLVTRLNQTRLRPTHRLEVARHFQQWFESRLAHWQEHASRLESQGQHEGRWDLLRSLEELTRAFRGVVEQVAEDDSVSGRAQLADAILQALRLHVLIMRLLLERYQEIPGQLWQESYRLFRIAQRFSLTLRAQQDSSGETVCIQQVFTQLLLMGAIDAYRQAPGLLPWIAAYLHRYAAALPLLPYRQCTIPVGADSLPAQFLVDLSSDRPPQAPWHLHLSATEAEAMLPDCLVLDARALEDLLPEHLRLLNEGADPALIHETLAQLSATDRQELLRQIGSALLPEIRASVRRNVWSTPVHIVQGFEAIRRNIGRSGDQGSIPLALAEDRTAEAPHSDWHMVDLSQTGMRLVCDHASTSGIEVGQLLTIQMDARSRELFAGQAPELADAMRLTDLSIVEVRWIRQNMRGGMQMGLQRLGEESQAARLYLNEESQSPMTLEVILVRTAGRVCIIAPASPNIDAGGVGRIEEEVSGLDRGQRVYFGLNRRRTRHFQLLQYVPIKTAAG